MASQAFYEESLVEQDEVIFPTANVIDSEPLYHNFTTIQNALQQHHEQKFVNQTIDHRRSHSIDDEHRSIGTTTMNPLLSSRHYYSNETLNMHNDHSSKPFRVPIEIQSKRIDGHIFNLTKIVEDIGYNPRTPFIRSSIVTDDTQTKNVSALLNIVLKMGGANGPLVNRWRSQMRSDYFEKWYLEKSSSQRSASTIQVNTVNHQNDFATQQARDQRSTRVIDQLISTPLPNNPTTIMTSNANAIRNIYGYQTVHPPSHSSSFSSQSSPSISSTASSSSIASILRKGNNNQGSTNKHVTIRDDRASNQFQQSRQTQDTQSQIIADYQQVLREHPDVYHDPNPEIISRSNADQMTYQQNISVRYLVPPTPPPPGPLIIREIIPARAPSPPPLIVKYQEPSPPTPPPLILREAPPPPPPVQEPTVITKVLPPEPQPPRRVIVERSPPLPPKPQEVIIEKWLPYKPAPPREVIYERITEQPASTHYQSDEVHTHRQRRHSAEFQSDVSRVSVPVNFQRQKSVEHSEQSQAVEQHSGTLDQFAWARQQHVLALQQHGRQQLEAHQQWAANQWHQHASRMMQYASPLPTPGLFVYQTPATMNAATYVEHREVHQQRIRYAVPGYIYQGY